MVKQRVGIKRVVIIGAGFAGIHLAQSLDNGRFHVVIVDRNNHHQFQPLLYQVAASQLEPSSVSFPLRYIFKHKSNVAVRIAEVLEIKHESRTVHTDSGSIKYDILVIAGGCKTNFFGNKEIESSVLTLKSTADAIRVRNHVLQTFENYTTADEQTKIALSNLTIVGAGPTGVELAGAFSEIKNNILPDDYPGVDFSGFRIILVEGGRYVLNSMSKKARNAAERYLDQMGVHLMKGLFVNGYDEDVLCLSNGELIPTKTVIWTAGVTANQFAGLPLECIGFNNRINVDRIGRVIGLEDVYAIGDVACMVSAKFPYGHPQTAGVAISQANALANNLSSMAQNKPISDYEYKDVVSMATIGRNKAVVDIGRVHIRGCWAWLIWMAVHLFLVRGLKKKLIIFINWAWTSVTKDSSNRLIFKLDKHL